MKRDKTLETASKLICGDRQEQYGDASVMFGKIAALWGAYIGVELKGTDAAHMMLLMKLARAQQGKFSSDTYVDLCGYAALAGEMMES